MIHPLIFNMSRYLDRVPKWSLKLRKTIIYREVIFTEIFLLKIPRSHKYAIGNGSFWSKDLTPNIGNTCFRVHKKLTSTHLLHSRSIDLILGVIVLDLSNLFSGYT